jgi:lipopolysaccharide/colanic/teichoic acid biosynthesis glycosyltransferase
VHRSSYAPIKRILDFTAAVVFSPIWILLSLGVAAVIRLDSPGAVMYRQERVGRRGNTFMLYKFRTMVHDAEMDGPKFASLDDPRITRVGRFLRKSRLDELPQLWNVIKGDLSIVGPRPERPIFVNKFRSEIPFYDSRHLIRPGLTGWAQVNYRYADDTAETVEKLTYDLYYVKNSSVWLDMRILGMSIWTVLTGSGAR